ncbi:MAG TPA: hypothetical protein VMH26_10575 [Burkholderiales bacterium]|nr:hypothetical protein [Burkholderiales bacterium]
MTLLTVPTIMYGGATLLGILTKGTAGIPPGDLALDQTQWALFRAGHAHAGVWVVLSLLIQVLLDSAVLSAQLKWLARVAAPLAALALSGGFFGLAFDSNFAWLLYFGAACLVLAVLVTGVGLLRKPNVAVQRGA